MCLAQPAIVAAAILAAVEGPSSVDCGGWTASCRPEWPLIAALTSTPKRQSAGQDARLYGRQDACCYAKHIPGKMPALPGGKAVRQPKRAWQFQTAAKSSPGITRRGSPFTRAGRTGSLRAGNPPQVLRRATH